MQFGRRERASFGLRPSEVEIEVDVEGRVRRGLFPTATVNVVLDLEYLDWREYQSANILRRYTRKAGPEKLLSGN